MSLAWYFNRLKAMSPAEIRHRIAEQARKRLAKGRLEGWERYRVATALPRLAGLSENLAAAPDGLRRDIIAASADLLSGHYRALGVTWPRRAAGELFPPEIWRLDPVTGRLWPGAGVYCFDIAYRHERQLGDIKYVWEFNRLQFLQPLAADAALTGNRAAIGAIEAAVESWHDANPPFRGLCWNAGIELGLRAISLLTVTSLCGPMLSEATIERICTILHAHMAWMARYPSRFSSANNHLVAEAAGEFLIALAMPDLPLSAGLEAKSRRILAEEAEKQILDDGAGAEQSPTYGAFSAEFILLCSQVARSTGRPLSSRIDARLKLFTRYIAWLSDRNGRVPGICDDDEGRVLTLCRHEPAYAASVGAAIAGYLGEPPAGPRPPEADLRDALFRSPQTGSPPPLGMTSFADGGQTVIRETRVGRELAVILDHGSLGYLSIAAHGHADALSVLATVDGRPLFIDPGTYLYHSGGKWRDWFRGTRAHNTLNIEGADQSIMSGAFNWSQKAVARLEEVSTGPDWSVTASHDGYEKRFGALHRRRIFSTSDGFAIHDMLAGNAWTAEIVFQLPPDCDAQLLDGKVQVRRDGEAVAVLCWTQPGNLAIGTGGDIGDGGWHSEAFGLKTEAARITWRGPIPPEGVLCTVALTPKPQDMAGAGK